MEEKETERRAVEDFFFFFLREKWWEIKLERYVYFFVFFLRFRDRYEMQ